MNWINGPTPLHQASFVSPILLHEQALSKKIVETLKHKHAAGFVEIPPSIMQLGAVASLCPEIGTKYGELTGHAVKGVVIVDPLLFPYPIPQRAGNFLMKPPGWGCRKDVHPHLSFCDPIEASQFALFGCATLAVVIKRRGVISSMDNLLGGLAAAIAHGRLEKLLIVSDETTSGADWQRAYALFASHGLTIGYSKMQ